MDKARQTPSDAALVRALAPGVDLDLARFLIGECDFRRLRMVGGVLCGTLDMVTTRALCIGVTCESPYERRYCYEDRAEADAALLAYADPDAHPLGQWIMVKGRHRGKWIDDLNPLWSRED